MANAEEALDSLLEVLTRLKEAHELLKELYTGEAHARRNLKIPTALAIKLDRYFNINEDE